MSGTVERNFSVDDLVGGIFRLQAAQGGGSMRKSDSEAAFQEFLKRIPSSSNLGGGGLSSQLHLDQLGSTNSLEAVANAGVLGGLPRVPSVDFLRQLASVQHQMNSGVSSPGFRVEDAGGAAMHPGLMLPKFSASDLAALSSLGSLPNSAANGAAVVAAALQQQQQAPKYQAPPPVYQAPAAFQPPAPFHAPTVLPYQAPAPTNGATSAHGGHHTTTAHHSSHRDHHHATANSGPANSTQTSGPSSADKDGGVDKSDARRARRMLSNRESARRSRRRKQEHLGTLEQEISVLLEEKKTVGEKVAVFEKRCNAAEDENRRLHEENERLRDALQFLRTELKERNRRHHRSHSSDEEDSDASPVAKKSRKAKDKDAKATEAA